MDEAAVVVEEAQRRANTACPKYTTRGGWLHCAADKHPNARSYLYNPQAHADTNALSLWAAPLGLLSSSHRVNGVACSVTMNTT